MKPVRVSMQAFGSYGRRTEVDFSKTDQNLFLITGDTGAGKTTIFDAIVFALYGEASSGSNKKDGVELQSQYIGLDTEPFVELTFTEKRGGLEEEYTVHRIPRHVRPAKRSKAKDQTISESVSLTLPDGSVYPEKETDKKIEEIVGLTKSQFMQVAMIAQGEFMELLRADSNKKKEIFRRLFNTELYQKLVIELEFRKKRKYAEREQITSACRQEAGHILVPENYERAGEMRELLRRVTGSARLNVTDMERLLEELALLCEFLDGEREKAEKDSASCGKDRDAAREACTAAQTLQKSFEQLEKAGRDLEECQEEEPVIRETDVLIAEIRAAYEILPVWQRVQDADIVLEEIRNNLEKNKEKLPRLTLLSEQAAAQEQKTSEEAEKEIGAFTKVSERVEKALEILRRIREESSRLNEKKKERETAVKTALRASSDLEELETKEKTWRRQAEELADADTRLALWKVKVDEAEKLRPEIEAAGKEQKETERQRLKEQKAKEAYEKIRTAYHRKKEEYDRAYDAFLDAQAGFIARTLKPGEPCPVCGATDHPSPCPMSEEHRDLTREDIDRLAAERDGLDKERQNQANVSEVASGLAREKEVHLEATLRKMRNHLAELVPEVPGAITPEEAEGIYASLRERLTEEGAAVRKAADLLHEVRDSLQGTDERKKALREKSEAASKSAEAAAVALAGAQTSLEALQEQVVFSTEEEAREALRSAEMRRKEAEKRRSAAREEAQKVHAASQQARTLIERYTRELPEREEERKRRKEEYEDTLAQKNLSESEWKERTAAYGKKDLEALVSRVEAHRRKKALAEGSFETARKAVGDRERPDMEALEAQRALSQQRFDEAAERLETVKTTQNTDRGAYKALAPIMEERAGVIREYARIESLYERLAGKKTGARMDIETYVQRYYLERILYAANGRFRDMSAGQFEFRMIGEEQAGEGKNRGLDLMVYSAVTGKEREVRTLSGGESFMAALSLALGMADQIREGSASVNLDMMFIDEGFGSLDEHSRNQAVKVLTRMAGGARLIGIISHVTELKQMIEDQLEVKKDEEGSHVSWILS